MNYVVLSCSLDTASRSRVLARIAQSHLEAAADCVLLDLRDMPIPPFDNDTIFSDRNFYMVLMPLMWLMGLCLQLRSITGRLAAF